MKPSVSVYVFALWSLAASATAPAGDSAGKFLRPDPERLPDVHLWIDVSNVWVLRDGEAALLVDIGDGSVLDHLGEIGVTTVEWVLVTHHHREGIQGHQRLAGTGARIGGPAAEQDLFERPGEFRKARPSLGDRYTVHGSSYARPPIVPLRLDRAFSSWDVLEWRGRTIWCVDAKGNSPGGMAYILRGRGTSAAFSGDVMLDGARMHTWLDTEWDYGFGSGLRALHASAAFLERFGPDWLFPAHGPAIRDPAPMLRAYGEKLRRLHDLLIRGYPEGTFASADQDRVSRPTEVPWVWELSPHLYKLKGPDSWPNFAIVIADSGRALVVDCGLLDTVFLDRVLKGLKERRGLRRIDAVVITHVHGDHMLQAPYLREKWGAPVWALDRMVPLMERPNDFDIAASVQSYGPELDAVKVDRAFRAGETFEWEGHRFTVEWMPGQTEYALCLHGEIDGRRVAFTGDNIFGVSEDPRQTGHEAVVARNSAILEEGYMVGADLLERIRPDLIVGGHSFAIGNPGPLVERYGRWAREMRDAFREILPGGGYPYGFDPFWVRAEPFRVRVKAGGPEAEASVFVRCFRPGGERYRVELHPAPGIGVEPAVLEGVAAGPGLREHRIRLRADAGLPPGPRIVALDLTVDGDRLGERFDLIAVVLALNPDDG